MQFQALLDQYLKISTILELNGSILYMLIIHQKLAEAYILNSEVGVK